MSNMVSCQVPLFSRPFVQQPTWRPVHSIRLRFVRLLGWTHGKVGSYSSVPWQAVPFVYAKIAVQKCSLLTKARGSAQGTSSPRSPRLAPDLLSPPEIMVLVNILQLLQRITAGIIDQLDIILFISPPISSPS